MDNIVRFSLNILLEESAILTLLFRGDYFDVCTLFLLYIVTFVNYDGTNEFFTS